MKAVWRSVALAVIVAILATSSVAAYYECYRLPRTKPELTGIERIKKRGVLVVGHDIYPPWSFRTEEGTWDGFDVEVMKRVAETLGVRYVGKEVIWESVIPALKAKEIDVIASAMSITPERSKEVLYTIPYYEVTLAFVVRADEAELYKTPEDFVGKAVGAQAGTTGWDLAKALYEGTGTDIKDFPMLPELLMALENGIVDVAIFDTPTARHYCNEEPEKFAVAFTHPTHGYPDYYAYAVRPEDGDLAEVINTVIMEMMESGELTELMEKWGVTP